MFRHNTLSLDERCAINSLIERYLTLVLDSSRLALRKSVSCASQTTNAAGEGNQLLDGQLRGLYLGLLLKFAREQGVFLDLLVEHHRNLVHLHQLDVFCPYLIFELVVLLVYFLKLLLHRAILRLFLQPTLLSRFSVLH